VSPPADNVIGDHELGESGARRAAPKISPEVIEGDSSPYVLTAKRMIMGAPGGASLVTGQPSRHLFGLVAANGSLPQWDSLIERSWGRDAADM
jgi:hypothetical protein